MYYIRVPIFGKTHKSVRNQALLFRSQGGDLRCEDFGQRAQSPQPKKPHPEALQRVRGVFTRDHNPAKPSLKPISILRKAPKPPNLGPVKMSEQDPQTVWPKPSLRPRAILGIQGPIWIGCVVWVSCQTEIRFLRIHTLTPNFGIMCVNSR